MTQTFQSSQLIPPDPLKTLSLPQDLVAWVTVGFSHGPHSEAAPYMASSRNFVGFLLLPFNFFYITEKHPATSATDISDTGSLGAGSA
jgi:diamine oxidase